MKRLKLGMVGGGEGAFIGNVHRIAARLDDRWSLVAGALSSDPDRAQRSGVTLGLAADRIYSDYQQMAEAEAARSDGIDAVAIVTPNHMHAPVAIAFLRAGIHVICDKPLAADLAQAEAIAAAAAQSGKQFVLTHNYTAYPMIRQARAMVSRGDLGAIRVVQVEYAQDWLTEAADNKQANWRTDPAQSGAGGCIGDIGTHAMNLAGFVSGLQLASVAADLDSFVDGRRVDDNVQLLLRFEGGAKGMLWASQVAPGNENALRLRIYGDQAGIEWEQEHPNQLSYTRFGYARQTLTRGGAFVGEESQQVTRLPPGHPEGYFEAFATLYSEVADLMEGNPQPQLPSIADGIFGMRFIAACLKSSADNGIWTKL